MLLRLPRSFASQCSSQLNAVAQSIPLWFYTRKDDEAMPDCLPQPNMFRRLLHENQQCRASVLISALRRNRRDERETERLDRVRTVERARKGGSEGSTIARTAKKEPPLCSNVPGAR